MARPGPQLVALVSARPVVATATAAAVLLLGWQMPSSSAALTATTQNAMNTFAVRAPGVAGAAVGTSHSCYVSAEGSTWCVGGNSNGQLGDGTQSGSMSWVRVKQSDGRWFQGIKPYHANAGGDSTCVWTSVLGAGRYGCWGANATGVLGDGTTTGRLHPVPMDGSAGGSSVSVDASQACFVSGGRVSCTTSSGSVVQVQPTLTTVTQVTVGGGHVCARQSDNSAWCWGNNTYGELGSGTSGGSSATAVRVVGVGGTGTLAVTSISAGGDHTCAVLTDDTAACWGRNADGQVGDVTNTDRAFPKRVMDGPVELLANPVTSVAGVTTGRNHACLWQTGAAAVFCWGRNADGQLGDTTTNARNYAVSSNSLNNVTGLFSGGEDSVLAIRTDGSLWAWGDNVFGKLGTGDAVDKTSPVQVRSAAAA